MGLEATTNGWTRARLMLQYEPHDSARMDSERESMTAHGYKEVQTIVDAQGRRNVQYAKAGVMPDRPAYGRMRESLAFPGDVAVGLVAWGEGYEQGWKLQLSVPGPDDRYASAQIDLDGGQVAALARHFGSARSLLTQIAAHPSATYTRAIGATASISVEVEAKGADRWVTISAPTRTGWTLRRVLREQDVRLWVAQLEYAQRRGPELLQELQATSA